MAGSPTQTLTFTGTGYLSSTAATLNGATLQTTYVSATTLQAVVPASALAAGQIANIVLSNPTPGGGSSPVTSYTIMSPTPAVKGLSPQSVPQGVSATITVNGSGFEANSVVMYNGAARPTTFVNGTTLQVTLTAADLQSYGSGQISVNNPGPGGSNTTPTELVIAATTPTILSVNPSSVPVNTTSNVPVLFNLSGSGFAANATVQANGTFVPVTTPAPGGGQSGALSLHIYQLLNVPANTISFDPFTRKIYAALPSTATSISGNSLVAIDPVSGSIGAPVQVGSEPNLLSETSDGNYLYIGLSGAKSLGRFNLLTQTMDVTVPIVSTAFGNTGDVAATSIAAVPGTDSSVAVEFDSFDGIGIYDISGSTGAFRSKLSSAYSGDNPVFTDATHFYAYDSYTTGAEFYRYSIDSTGITLIDGTTLNGFGGFGGKLAVDGGLVFGSAGGIVNPSTTPPSQVAVLSLGNGTSSSSLVGGGVIPYQAESKAFVVGVNDAGTAAYYLERFDTQHFTQEQQIQLPGNSVSALPGVRFGQDGLAYVIPGNSTSQPAQVFLIRGPFVVPAEAGSNPAPSLSSASQSTIAAGTGNLYLTVTGTGFLPGAVVLWNGSPRTTTFVDSTHLSVAIAAADLATANTITLTSQNPGSGASNSLSVTVQ